MLQKEKTPILNFRFAYILIFFLYFSLLPCSSFAEEKILSYHSEIEILKNSELLITETIKILSEGRDVKRGIYRSFPTDFKTDSGKRVRVGFEVLSVKRDGRKESYHIKRVSNGKVVYAGKSSNYLDPGEYVYEFKYKTNQQVGFFDKYDELYYNAIGTDWKFKIENAGCTLKLPRGVPIEKVFISGFTGPQGGVGKNFTFEKDVANAAINFTITKPLMPKEGFTFISRIPKAYIKQPTFLTKVKWFTNANKGISIIGFGAVTSLIYYFISWLLFGIDPKKGTIIPRFESPAGLSPQEVRYLYQMNFDDKCYASALVNMAYQGAITLREPTKASKIRLILKASKKANALAEKELLSKLLKSEHGNIEFHEKHFKKISESKKELEKALKKKHQNSFSKNTLLWFLGLFIILACVIGSFFLEGIAFFEHNFLSILVGGVVACFLNHFFQELLLLKNQTSFYNKIYFLKIIFFLAFLIYVQLNINFFNEIFYFSTITLFLVLVFRYLLKAPSIKGRAVMDQIEGYRMYLKVAEDESLQGVSLPEINKEHFEKHLPYAFALDAEEEWTQQFVQQLESINEPTSNISPSWYTSFDDGVSSSQNFTKALGAGLVTAIASSSMPPASSSSSSGGGFSGGGGGGGGGGGW